MVQGREDEKGADPVVPVERPALQVVEGRAGRDGLGNEVSTCEVWDLPQGQGNAC